MHRRALIKAISASTAVAVAGGFNARASSVRTRPPNFFVILCDDLGYGDLTPFGGRVIKTPNIERLAHEGTVLSDYYAPANLCTPSRAGLLTGRYPIRTGLGYEVIMADDDRGLPLSEVTIAKSLKPQYATALFGKWHLGHIAPFWPPTKHGFDSFFGIPYSHDMKPLSLYESHTGSEEIKSTSVDYPQLQQQFYSHAERFVEENKARPFFVELALSAPHLPEYPHAPYAGTSAGGAYGDVVVEIDAIVGRLLGKLRTLDLEQDTLIIFTSDNGPWFEGSTGGLRDRKGGGGFDGGYRVPFIARQPGVIPGGRRVQSIVSGVDLLPTLCAMATCSLPPGVTLDGYDVGAVLRRGAISPRDEIVLFDNEEVIGIRTQRWKLLEGSYYRSVGMVSFPKMGYTELYDLAADPSESYSVASAHPDVVAEMQTRLARAKATFAPFKHKDLPQAFLRRRGIPPHSQD